MDLGDETLENSGAVRANCLITGYYVEELSEKAFVLRLRCER